MGSDVRGWIDEMSMTPTPYHVPHAMEAFYGALLGAGWTRPNDGLPGEFLSPVGDEPNVPTRLRGRTRVVHAGGICEIHYRRPGATEEDMYSRPYGQSERDFGEWLDHLARFLIEGAPSRWEETRNTRKDATHGDDSNGPDLH